MVFGDSAQVLDDGDFVTFLISDLYQLALFAHSICVFQGTVWKWVHRTSEIKLALFERVEVGERIMDELGGEPHLEISETETGLWRSSTHRSIKVKLERPGVGAGT